jgi:NAD+ kinase
VWIATAAGSTAAIHAAGGRILPLGSGLLQFVVREPFRLGPLRRSFRLSRGTVRGGRSLVLTNMWQPAVLYMDGPHYTVPVPPASVVRLSRSPLPLRLLGYDEPGRRRRSGR